MRAARRAFFTVGRADIALDGVMRIAFLGYDRRQTRLLTVLEAAGSDVFHTADPILDLSGFDLAVSFGFRHILRSPTIASARRPILNLHISLLPHNRGADPNFWAHMDRTPHGVTIHEIDAGLDTGPIVFQQEVVFSADENNFARTHRRLILEIEDLFESNLDALFSGRYEPRPQASGGSHHRKADLPTWMRDWTMSIDAARRLHDAPDQAP